MIFIARLIHFIFGMYITGLILYAFLRYMNFSASPKINKIFAELGRLYLPFLNIIKNQIKPIKIGNTSIDLSYIIFIAAIYILRNILIFFLVPRF